MTSYWVAIFALLAIYVGAAAWVILGNFYDCEDFSKLFFGKHDQED